MFPTLNSTFGRLNAPSANAGQMSGTIQQLLLSVAVVVGLYLSFVFVEVMYNYINRLSMNRTELLPFTYAMDNKTLTVSQNPTIAGSKPVHLSDNERSGIEFSYSFYINVHPSAFQQYDGLLHIFHKGYPSQFPLLGPGVYMHANNNTMRIYMNTFKTWNNFVEVQNIPIGQWAHIVMVCKQSALEVYVNGNLSRKLSFDGYAPYQNYQDIICFSQMSKKYTMGLDNILDVKGALKGMMSRLIYFSYALSYSEIQTLMNEGPSTKMDDNQFGEVPPYLADNWWTTTS